MEADDPEGSVSCLHRGRLLPSRPRQWSARGGVARVRIPYEGRQVRTLQRARPISCDENCHLLRKGAGVDQHVLGVARSKGEARIEDSHMPKRVTAAETPHAMVTLVPLDLQCRAIFCQAWRKIELLTPTEMPRSESAEDVVLSLARNHGVVVQTGGLFDSERWDVRVCLAALDADQLGAVGRAIVTVVDSASTASPDAT